MPNSSTRTAALYTVSALVSFNALTEHSPACGLFAFQRLAQFVACLRLAKTEMNGESEIHAQRICSWTACANTSSRGALCHCSAAK